MVTGHPLFHQVLRARPAPTGSPLALPVVGPIPGLEGNERYFFAAAADGVCGQEWGDPVRWEAGAKICGPIPGG